MESGKFYVIDNSEIKWLAQQGDFGLILIPYCKIHNLKYQKTNWTNHLKCPDCSEPRRLSQPSLILQREYVADKINASNIAKIDIVNIDGELVPIAKMKFKNEDYGISAQIMDSKHGKQLVIYAGKKGYKNTQIFVDTEKHKLAFDHKNIKPTEIFAKIEATFKDSSKMTIEAEPET